MENIRSETWKEVKEGLWDALKIVIYSALGLGLFFGAGYVYLTCFH